MNYDEYYGQTRIHSKELKGKREDYDRLALRDHEGFQRNDPQRPESFRR